MFGSIFWHFHPLDKRGVKLVTIWCLSRRFFLVRFLTAHLLRKTQLRWEKSYKALPYSLFDGFSKNLALHTQNIMGKWTRAFLFQIGKIIPFETPTFVQLCTRKRNISLAIWSSCQMISRKGTSYLLSLRIRPHVFTYFIVPN